MREQGTLGLVVGVTGGIPFDGLEGDWSFDRCLGPRHGGCGQVCRYDLARHPFPGGPSWQRYEMVGEEGADANKAGEGGVLKLDNRMPKQQKYQEIGGNWLLQSPLEHQN